MFSRKSFLFTLICMLAYASVATAARDAVIANISKFDGTNSCSGGSNFSYGNQIQDYLADKLAEWGYDTI